MRITKRTCLVCRKPREALASVDDISASIDSTYKIKLPNNIKKICVKCHVYLSMTIDLNKSRPKSFNKNCFGCQTDKNLVENVDTFLQNLLSETTVIKIRKPPQIKAPTRACPNCLCTLQKCVKYEALLGNVLNPKLPVPSKGRFSKQFATLKDFNVELNKIPLESLDNILNIQSPISTPENKGSKRKHVSFSADLPSKRSKIISSSFDTPRSNRFSITARASSYSPPPKKSSSSPSKKSPPKKRGPKPGAKAAKKEEIYIKFPVRKQKRVKKVKIVYGKPHSASLPVEDPTNVDELNKTFGITLKSFNISVEKLNPTLYLGGRLAVTGMRPTTPVDDDFIGLDDEDVMNYTANSTLSTNGEENGGKRKSILVSENRESPNLIKKKVKFSESPSVKVIEAIESEEDTDAEKEDKDKKEEEDEKDGNKEIVENGVDDEKKDEKEQEKEIIELDKEEATVDLNKEEETVDLDKKEDEKEKEKENEEGQNEEEKEDDEKEQEKDIEMEKDVEKEAEEKMDDDNEQPEEQEENIQEKDEKDEKEAQQETDEKANEIAEENKENASADKSDNITDDEEEIFSTPAKKEDELEEISDDDAVLDLDDKEDEEEISKNSLCTPPSELDDNLIVSP